MNLLPYESFEITTKLTPDEATLRLKKVITTNAPSRNEIPDKAFLFIGKIIDNKFRLLLNRYHKPSAYTPIAQGIILSSQTGSRVSVKVLPNNALIVLGLILTCVEILLIMAAISSREWPIITISVLMPFLAYGLTLFIIKYDAANIKATLLKLWG